MVETTLSRYYRALDEGRIDDALQMLDPDVRFVMVLPAGTRRGHGRDEMGGYLGGRGVPDRAHVVLRQSRDDDVEFLYGRVTDGGATTGRFLSGARVGCERADRELRGHLRHRARPGGRRMTSTPFLEAWFAIMDSDQPERVLDRITDDFVMSIQFSKGEGQSAEFVGDRAGLVAYLEQREKSVLVHEVTQGARVDDVELVLGRTTRDGVFEASFNASALLDPATDRCRRLLIGRTPQIEFPE